MFIGIHFIPALWTALERKAVTCTLLNPNLGLQGYGTLVGSGSGFIVQDPDPDPGQRWEIPILDTGTREHYTDTNKIISNLETANGTGTYFLQKMYWIFK
jgi:hypothetical protein